MNAVNAAPKTDLRLDLTPDIILEKLQCFIQTACKNRTMIVRSACILPLTINGHTEKMRRAWLKAQKVVNDHDLDCLYIGDNTRHRVFLTCNNNAKPEFIAPPEFFASVQHGFPKEYIKHDIELMSNIPFRLPPYGYSTEKKKAIKVQVRQMLADGLIEPSLSPYSSPIVMDRKKNEEFRFAMIFAV